MYNTIEELQGKTLNNVAVDRENDEIIFTTTTGEKYKMYHQQDCCESVTIEDINGDINDLINTPILLAEERTNENETDWGHETFTFYTFRTSKGDVDIRWHGESNGYYSESVYISRM